MWRVAFRSAAVLGTGLLAAPVAYSAVEALGNELRPDSQYDVYLPSFPKLVKRNSERALDALFRPNMLDKRLTLEQIDFSCFQPTAGPSKKDFKMDARLGLDGFNVIKGDPITLYCPHDIVIPYKTILLQLPVNPAARSEGGGAAFELLQVSSENALGIRRYELALAVQDFYCANADLVRWRELDFVRFEGTHEMAGTWLPIFRAYMFTHDPY